MPEGDKIFERLKEATNAEIETIASILDVKLTSDRSRDVDVLSRELRSCAGGVIANLRRGAHDLPYRQILEDVVGEAAQRAGWPVPQVSDSAWDRWLEAYVVKALAFAEHKKDASKARSEEARKEAESELKECFSHRGMLEGMRAFASDATMLRRNKNVLAAMLCLIHIQARLVAELHLGGKP